MLYILSELQQFAYGSGTYAGQFRFRKEQNGFNSCQLAVYIGNRFLVLEILYRAYAAYNQTGIHFFGEVNGQTVV